MKVENIADIDNEIISGDAVKGVSMRMGIGTADGAPRFAMRLFTVEEDGHTPFHHHPWEHEVYIVDGQGLLVLEGKEKELKKGDFVYVDPNLKHQFKNTGEKILQFICVIPHPERVIAV